MKRGAAIAAQRPRPGIGLTASASEMANCPAFCPRSARTVATSTGTLNMVSFEKRTDFDPLASVSTVCASLDQVKKTARI